MVVSGVGASVRWSHRGAIGARRRDRGGRVRGAVYGRLTTLRRRITGGPPASRPPRPAGGRASRKRPVIAAGHRAPVSHSIHTTAPAPMAPADRWAEVRAADRVTRYVRRGSGAPAVVLQAPDGAHAPAALWPGLADALAA